MPEIWKRIKKVMNTLGGTAPPAETTAPAKKKPVTPSPPSMEGTMTPQQYAAKKAALDAFAASREAPSSQASRLEQEKKKRRAMMGP